MFKYMKYMMIAMAIVDKAQDGELTRDEVIDCIQGALPEDVNEIVDGVQEALDDGKITVGEAIRVLANSKLLD